MKKEINQNKAGLSLGILMGVMHFLWVIIIEIGLGNSLMNLWKRIHFVEIASMTQFNLGIALLGIFYAFILGYIIAWLFSWVYNKL